MAKVTLTKTNLPGSYPATPLVADSADLVLTAASVASKNQFAPTGKEIIVAYNSGGSPYTVTINSVADENKRTGDITTYSIGAGEIAVFGPVLLDGWRQSDGYIYLEASNAAVKFAVISI